MTCNLINAMSDLGLPVYEVLPLFDIIKEIVDQRIPPEIEDVDHFYAGKTLENFSNEEIFVTLLISRLKTFT